MRNTIILKTAEPGVCPGCGQPYRGNSKTIMTPSGLDIIYEMHGRSIRERYSLQLEAKCPECHADGEKFSFLQWICLTEGGRRVIVYEVECMEDYGGCGSRFTLKATAKLREVHVDDPSEHAEVLGRVLARLRETVTRASADTTYRTLSPNEDKDSVHFVTAAGCGIGTVPELDMGPVPTIIADAVILRREEEDFDAVLDFEDRDFHQSVRISHLCTEDLEKILAALG